MYYAKEMIYDIISYNGEAELFEIRYNILKDYVDQFRVIEFDKTFSGKPKERTFNQVWDKVIYYWIPEKVWSKYLDLARLSPNTEYGKGAEHWLREFAMKESIKDCLGDLKDDDRVFIGDCDEIWDPIRPYNARKKLKLRVYTYYLNNRSTEKFAGTLTGKWGQIKNECLNHLRSNAKWTEDFCGWHFTSIGGIENVKKKLTDSYTQDSYATEVVLNNLAQNIYDNKDFLGRQFDYIIDTREWPAYLTNNSHNYRHLLKQ